MPCFAVGVWRDHTEWCASCFHGGKSREITPSGVLSVLLMKSNEITLSGVLAVLLMKSNVITPSGELAVFMLGGPERSHRVEC